MEEIWIFIYKVIKNIFLVNEEIRKSKEKKKNKTLETNVRDLNKTKQTN